MSWFLVISSVVALALAFCSVLVAYFAYRVAAFQTWPYPDIDWLSSGGGHRSLDFRIVWVSGQPDWAVKRVSVHRNWFGRRYLALGKFLNEYEVPEGGDVVREYEPSGEWRRVIEFRPPVPEGAVVLRSDAPECEVKLELTLRTLPSPKVKRRIWVAKL